MDSDFHRNGGLGQIASGFTLARIGSLFYPYRNNDIPRDAIGGLEGVAEEDAGAILDASGDFHSQLLALAGQVLLQTALCLLLSCLLYTSPSPRD